MRVNSSHSFILRQSTYAHAGRWHSLLNYNRILCKFGIVVARRVVSRSKLVLASATPRAVHQRRSDESNVNADVYDLQKDDLDDLKTIPSSRL